ncbi:MAG: YlbF family regulator, partial [Atribacterota bacterium]|nr:YlbF family regulator [Atribacterota bacterium]
SIMNLLRDEQERLLEISCERDIEESDFTELNNLHEKANNNQLIRSYLEAEKSLFQLTQALNTEITSLIGFDFALSVIHRDDDDEEAVWE